MSYRDPTWRPPRGNAHTKGKSPSRPVCRSGFSGAVSTSDCDHTFLERKDHHAHDLPCCFHEYEDGRFAVVFPDLRHLSTCEDDLHDAMSMAIDCRAGYIYTEEQDGHPLPPPTPFPQFDAHCEDDGHEKEEGVIRTFSLIVPVDVTAYARAHFQAAPAETDPSIVKSVTEGAPAAAKGGNQKTKYTIGEYIFVFGLSIAAAFISGGYIASIVISFIAIMLIDDRRRRKNGKTPSAGIKGHKKAAPHPLRRLSVSETYKYYR